MYQDATSTNVYTKFKTWELHVHVLHVGVNINQDFRIGSKSGLHIYWKQYLLSAISLLVQLFIIQVQMYMNMLSLGLGVSTISEAGSVKNN